MNKNRSGFIATFVLIVLSGFSYAQGTSAGREIKKADVNFTELAKYYEEHPLLLTHRNPFNENEDEDQKPRHRAAHGADVHLYDVAAAEHVRSDSRHGAYLPASPAPIDTFESTASDGSSFPPDTHGAVDSQYCVTAINTAIHIQTRTGGNVLNVGISGFWASVLPSGIVPFDPRVHYDPLFKRWILITDAVNYSTMTQSTLLVAVSATNDPTGTWHMYAIAVDPTGAAWMDFPNVGYNKKWITVTGNMFRNSAGGARGARLYTIDYNAVMSGTGAPYTIFSKPSSFSIAPAITLDTNETSQFAIESWNGTAGQLQLWKITGSVSSPTLTSVGYPTTTTNWDGGPPGGDFAPQVSSPNYVNTGDDRITAVIYRNHKLWCSHTAFLPAGGANRCSIMWWQIDTLANPLQNGLIDDPTVTNFYAFSSIAVNVNDDALIGFANFKSTIHPSAAYALHVNTDGINSTRSPVIYRHGTATYYASDGSRNRWGDYSEACIDPRNDTDFWTIQEVSASATTPNWDTWWANVQFCPKPSAPVLFRAPSLCIGATGYYYVNPIAGATSYQWIVSGAGWVSDGSTADSSKMVAGTTVATVTVVAYNSCGQGESLTFLATPVTAPVKPSITTITAPCVGASSATFSAATSGATSYSWTVSGTGWSGSSSSPSLTTVVGAGTATITCVASNVCGSSPVDTLVITPSAVPVAAFTIASHITATSINDVVTFSGTAAPGASYAWTFAGGTATPGTGAGPQTVYWTSAGLKTLSLEVFNGGCTSNFYTDTVRVIDTVTTGIMNPGQHSLSISIVPNPNDGSFDIVLDKAVHNTLFVQLADMQGRIVYSNEFNSTANNKLSVVSNNLTPGNYIVTVLVDGIPVTEKITITR